MSVAGSSPFFPFGNDSVHSGISQVDWFAAMALQGLVTRGMEVSGDRVLNESERSNEMVRRAYMLADGMVRESNKRKAAAKLERQQLAARQSATTPRPLPPVAPLATS